MFEDQLNLFCEAHPHSKTDLKVLIFSRRFRKSLIIGLRKRKVWCILCRVSAPSYNLTIKSILTLEMQWFYLFFSLIVFWSWWSTLSSAWNFRAGLVRRKILNLSDNRIFVLSSHQLSSGSILGKLEESSSTFDLSYKDCPTFFHFVLANWLVRIH